MVDWAEIYGIDDPLTTGLNISTPFQTGPKTLDYLGTPAVQSGGAPSMAADEITTAGLVATAGKVKAAQEALGIIGEAGQMLGIGTDLDFSSILPGGEPYAVDNLPDNQRIAKRWWTGTALFVISDLGRRYVWLKSQQRWKRVSTKKAFHVGRNPTSKNVKRLGAAMAHHKKTAKIYNKLFPKPKTVKKEHPHGHGCKCSRCC